jgi:hypothetical protein
MLNQRLRLKEIMRYGVSDAEFLDWASQQSSLDPGQMIIWEHALTSLKEQVRYLIDRAKYFGEGEKPKAEYIELMQDIEARIIQIQKTSAGSA